MASAHPLGVGANLWLRAGDRPPVANNRIPDVGFGGVSIGLTWSDIREFVELSVVVLC